MVITFHIKNRLLIHVQNLVKKYDGRFVGNPIKLFRDDMCVKVSFENENGNKFFHMVHILQRPWV